MSVKPMLAGKATDDRVREMFAGKESLFASPKLDGVRGLVIDGQLMSRSLKPIRNKHVQAMFGRPGLSGLDGELIMGDPTAPDVYRKTNSAVMSIEGEPNVKFYAFDSFATPCDPFVVRHETVADIVRDERAYWITRLPQTVIGDFPQLASFEQRMLSEGYEGVMLRAPMAPYKFGRSTLKEGYLLKLKRFSEDEAVVLEVIEEMHNTNDAQTNELGRTFRSTAKDGKVGKGTMGAFRVRDLKTGQEFKVGTGFDAEFRAAAWVLRDVLVDDEAVLKYKHFSVGAKDLPRHPVFVGWRDRDDMS